MALALTSLRHQRLVLVVVAAVVPGPMVARASRQAALLEIMAVVVVLVGIL